MTEIVDIMRAIKSSDISVLRNQFNENSDFIFKRIPAQTWLHYATRNSTPEVLCFLINEGLNVNVVDCDYGHVPLIEGVSIGKVENIKCLIEKGSILDTSKTGRNPLFAVSSGASTTLQNERKDDPSVDINADDPRFLKITKLLLEAGIDATVRYNDGWEDMDALAFALMWGQTGIAQIIAEWIAKDDKKLVEALLADAKRVARENTKPVRTV